MRYKILVLATTLSLLLSGILIIAEETTLEGNYDEINTEFESTGFADSPWPSFGRDRKNTHLSPYDTSRIEDTERWNFETEESVRSSPSIGPDGTIYVSSVDNNLYALNSEHTDGEAGTEKWSFETDGVIESSPAIAEDGTIYVGSYDNKLYAIHSE